MRETITPALRAHPDVQALEAFNVKLCADSGAGKGAETTPAASARYAALLIERREECTHLLDACDKVGVSHFASGMRAYLNRAIEIHT